MALQLLKRPFTMAGSGYDQPKILKNGPEMRWTPDRVRVDEGDIVMNMRMDNSKTRFVGESIRKYASGLNPYGESSHPYKVNKQFRPPIYDPKLDQAISRMPQKFTPVTIGPIVSDLYKKQVEIAKISPKTTIDKVCPDAMTNPYDATKCTRTDIRDLNFKPKIKSAVQAMPSLFIQTPQEYNMELDPKISTSTNSGIHAPWLQSDWSRDVQNMRTPTHVAIKTSVQDLNHLEPVDRSMPDLTPKTKTAAWNNPTYFFVDTPGDTQWVDAKVVANKIQVASSSNPQTTLVDIDSDRSTGTEDFIANRVKTSAQSSSSYRLITHQGHDVPIRLQNRIHTSQSTNPNYHMETGDRSSVDLETPIHAGSYDPRANIPTIQDHPVYTRSRTLEASSHNTDFQSYGNGSGSRSGGSYEQYQGHNSFPSRTEGFQVGGSDNNSYQDATTVSDSWGPGGVGGQTFGLPQVGMRSSAIRSNPLRVQRNAEPLNGTDNGVRLNPINSASKFVKW
jgi:hypothetical protein